MKRQQKHRKHSLIARHVFSPTPPPIRYPSGVNVLEDGPIIPHRSLRLEALSSPGKGIAVEKLSKSKALSRFIKEARCQAMNENTSSCSSFIEDESSLLASSEPKNMDVVELEAILEEFATSAEPSHERLGEAFAEIQDITQSG